MNNKIFREILIALSLANILFAGSWRMYLYPPTYEYHIKIAPNRFDYLGIILAVGLTAAIFFGLFRLFRFYYKEQANLLINLTFFVLFLFALHIFRLQFPYSSLTFPIAIASQILFFGLLSLTLTKWRNQIFKIAKVFVLMLSPFILITFSQAISGIINYTTPENEIPVSTQLSNIQPREKDNIKTRVVWIIFDEFDYRIPFDLKAVEMPEFERLKQISLTATNANSPARSTLEAIPSLLTGKKILKGEPKGGNELILKFPDGSKEKFSETPSIFSEVKALGGDTAVNGFYHAYCRTIGQQLSVCKWMDEQYIPNESVAGAVLNNFNILYSQLTIMFATDAVQLKQTFDANLEDDKWHIQELIENPDERLSEVYEIAASPKIDLAFIHLPIPHPPSRFKRLTKEYTPDTRDYIDNLALTDIVLGEIRRRMEDAGQWENSTVIVSTDHPLRVNLWKESKYDFTGNDLKLTGGTEDSRIPFFIKLKNQNQPLVYEKPFDTVITRDLILAVMKGEISSPDELKNRLDSFENLE